MNIILIATECFPFAKATSLGDLISVLAKDLEKEGHNVKIFIPRYGCIDPSTFHIERIPLELKINLNGSNIPSSVFKGILPNSMASVFFIESQSHFSNSKEIYFTQSNQNEAQNRNFFFCLAALETISRLKLNADIIHIFNPACTQIAKLLHSKNIEYSHLKKSKLVFTLQSLEELSENQVNVALTKETITYSDFITTTSKTFEEELLLNLHNTEISESLVKKRGVFKGILSNVENETYNPEADPDLAQTYSKSYFSIGKRKCKEDLYDLLGFEKDIQLPLFGTVIRLTKDSGVELLIKTLPEIADLNLQLVIMGKGEEEFEEKLTRLSKNYKNIKVCIGYNHNFVKKIYAGADFYMCPSEIQPDGYSVLAAMKYGSIPIVFYSGAIKEMITDIDSFEEANGIIVKNYTKEDFFESTIRAIKLYKNKEKWTKLVKQAMSFDISSVNTGKSYVNCYEAAANANVSQEVPLAK